MRDLNMTAAVLSHHRGQPSRLAIPDAMNAITGIMMDADNHAMIPAQNAALSRATNARLSQEMNAAIARLSREMNAAVAKLSQEMNTAIAALFQEKATANLSSAETIEMLLKMTNGEIEKRYLETSTTIVLQFRETNAAIETIFQNVRTKAGVLVVIMATKSVPSLPKLSSHAGDQDRDSE